MRHLTAVSIDGGWRYASLSRRGGYALGYCDGHLHDTEAEARDCYGGYLRDHIRLDAMRVSWTACEVRSCANPTKSCADIEGDGYALAALCPEHMTLEHATRELGVSGPAGDAWVS